MPSNILEQFGPYYAADDGSGGGSAEGGNGGEDAGDDSVEAGEEAGGEDSGSKDSAASKAFGGEKKADDGEGNKITDENTGTTVRPEYVPENYFDKETGEVNLEQAFKDLKETKRALHNKQGVPEPTEENPFGYNYAFATGSGKEGEEGYVEGLGFPEEYFQSEELLEYANEAREAGIGQEQFEWQFKKFHQWKVNYDNQMGYYIDSGIEAQMTEDYFTNEYGKNAEQMFHQTKAWMEDENNMHPDVSGMLFKTAKGIEYGHAQMMATMDSKPGTSDERSIGNVNNMKDLDDRIKALDSDERAKLSPSDPARQKYEEELNEAYQERFGHVKDDDEGNPKTNPNHSAHTKDPDDNAKERANQRYRRYKVR